MVHILWPLKATIGRSSYMNCALLTLLYAASLNLFGFGRSSQVRMCTSIQSWLMHWRLNSCG